MSKFTIIDSLIEQGTTFNSKEVIVSITISAILTYFISKLYIKYGTALSNRKKFADNLLLLGVTTTLIISIIKSSLALSLGLVGSLSIIRFRTSIKEPEELAYLFLVIAIGIGSGANQIWLTITAIGAIGLIIIIKGLKNKKIENQNFYITISSKEDSRITLQRITQILIKQCEELKLKRFEFADNTIEASYLVNIKSFNNLNNIKEQIKRLSKNVTITYIELDELI